MASIGEFIHGGEGFRITEPVTLTPMLNVLCNLEASPAKSARTVCPVEASSTRMARQQL